MIDKTVNYLRTNTAILLAFLTGYTYYISYSYEVGICKFYQIPETFIEITPISIITCLRVIFYSMFFLGILYFVFILYIPYKWKMNTYLRRLLQVDGVLIIIGIVFYVFVGGSYQLLIAYSVFIITLTICLYFSPRDKNTKELEIEFSQKDKDYIGKIILIIVSVFLLITTPMICEFLAKKIVTSRNYFYILKSHPSFFLAKKVDDTYIFKNYIPANKTVGDSLLIIKAIDTNKILLVGENLQIK